MRGRPIRQLPTACTDRNNAGDYMKKIVIPRTRNLHHLPRDSNRSGTLLLLLLMSIHMLIGCGANSPVKSVGDFSVSVSPGSVSTVVGSTTPAILISADPQDEFTGAISISIQGIPAGVTVNPAPTFSVETGASQSVTFTVSGSAAIGPSTLMISGVSGQLSHNAALTLTAEAIVHSYQKGSVLYLESGSATDKARIGLETAWGGSITEVSANGTEYVNRHDTGREVQPSYRDGDNLNYNPTLAGDGDDQGTPTISYTLSPDSLFIQAQPLQWYAEAYGGGIGQPISGDVLVEQTVTAVVSEPHTFRVHIKATHLGSDLHTNTGQEFPAVYTNRDYGRFISYNGETPWTNAAITVTQLPDLGQPVPTYYIPERWGALVNDQNQGLTVYVPSVNPYVIGFRATDNTTPADGTPTDNATNYFAPLGNLTIGPGSVFEGDFYVIAGDFSVARQIIYRLHQNLTIPVIFAPFEATDQPASGATVSKTTTVTGWAFADGANVTKIEVLVDNVTDGIASYGDPRPDVQQADPDSPLNVGFSYTLNTTRYPNGTHRIYIRVTDSSGNVAIAPSVPVTFSNL
jgi:Bacterial Ig domain